MWKVANIEGCSNRVLGGILHKTAVSGAITGSKTEDTHAAVPIAVGVQKTKTWLRPPKQNYCLKRDINSS